VRGEATGGGKAGESALLIVQETNVRGSIMMRFDGKVALITGAGNGLGRSHALLLAARGARVLVNDLGGGASGGGESSSAADRVVAEIRAAGGEAVASYDSVESGERIVAAALDAFGKIDIVINNAGILRDVSFAKMSREDWDLVLRVHLHGSFSVTHAAWPHLRRQEWGRVIMTTSAAGLYGNFGQANYGAAKMGILGLAQTLAHEGRRRNILVNTIAPIAGSRLTETILAQELVRALKPEYVSALVAYLCHDDCADSGALFEVGGGFFSRVRWQRAGGKVFRLGREMTPEAVAGAWREINAFDDPERVSYPRDLAGSMGPIMSNIQAGPSRGGNQFIDLDAALGYEFPESSFAYDERDAAIYALGVGAASDPRRGRELQFVYENHTEGFWVLPTFGVVPGLDVMLRMARKGESAPGCNYGLERLLHGEQYTEVLRPLPPRAQLTNRTRIVDIFDKGENALVITETRSCDESGEELIVNRFTAVIRGAGGWGGERGASTEKNVPPERDPDVVVRERISESQALLYRLSGDWNPLHADPNFARAFGFERPILHGLCTYGYVARQVINEFLEGDPRRFKSIEVRFAESVYPGETLVTEMWRVSATRVVLRASVAERECAVITQAAVEWHPEAAERESDAVAEAGIATEAVAATEAAGAALDATAEVVPTSADVFLAIDRHLHADPELAESIQMLFQFRLRDPQSAWVIDLQQGAVRSGEESQVACTLTLSDADFMRLCAGEVQAQELFFGGKLQISGNVLASQKLEFLQTIDPAQVIAVARERVAGGGSREEAEATEGKPADADPVATDEAGSPQVVEGDSLPEPEATLIDKIMAKVDAYLRAHPETRAAPVSTLQLRLTDPDSEWLVRGPEQAVGDGEDDASCVTRGSDPAVAATLTLRAADLAALFRGEEELEALFMQGRLHVDGDPRLVRHLWFIEGLWSE
jgi:3-hydroxyacyl-CoA dehydrogenase/3a,7a,12a-trihydroxy-5b-cholest-24-enoyl-CoA hydratase